MALISYNALDVIFRDLDDVIILKNVRCNEIMTLENVSADIWRFISSEGRAEFYDIVANISELYDISQDEIIDDIEEFINVLFEEGVIMINGSYYITTSEENNQSKRPQEDFEGQIMQIYQDKGLIYSVTFELTYACNERCIHCYANYPTDSNKKQPLTIEQVKKVISDLYQMKCMHITFTGGDPFMFKEFTDLFVYTRNMGFSCDIFTNAVYLSEHPEELSNILAHKPQAFFISLYGADAETHEGITTIPGSFNKTVSTIKKIKQAGISVVLNVMLLKNNVDKIESIVSFIKELDVEYRIGISLIYKNDGSDSPMQHFVEDKNAIKKALSIEKERFYSIDQHIGAEKENDVFFCGAGRTSLDVSPDGTVFPCVSLKYPMGNIFDEAISNIWNSEKRRKLISLLSWENATKCRECKYVDKCPHCIGISQLETGDMFSCNTCDKLLAECLYEIDY